MSDFTADEIRAGNANLEKVAQATEEHPAPSMFSMRVFGHRCGTPACALGSYAARPDLQDVLVLTEGGFLESTDTCDLYQEEDLLEHFAITLEEQEQLFGSTGCDSAQTPEDAAAYIRAFVSRRASRAGAGE